MVESALDIELIVASLTVHWWAIHYTLYLLFFCTPSLFLQYGNSQVALVNYSKNAEKPGNEWCLGKQSRTIIFLPTIFGTFIHRLMLSCELSNPTFFLPHLVRQFPCRVLQQYLLFVLPVFRLLPILFLDNHNKYYLQFQL